MGVESIEEKDRIEGSKEEKEQKGIVRILGTNTVRLNAVWEEFNAA